MDCIGSSAQAPFRQCGSLQLRIEIFGTGCARCEKTAREITRLVEKLGVDATIDHVTNMKDIVDRGVMLTPAVYIDGEKKAEGKVPKASEIEAWLRAS